MMKFMFFMFFSFFICLKNMFWLIQMILLLMMFMYLGLNLNFNVFSNISYYFGVDMISYGLILLSIWICMLMIMASENLLKSSYYYKFFLINVIFLLIFLVLTFSSMNLFLFYIFFESSLIPTLMLIIIWGYQPERMQAGLYLMFYTLFASLPLLMGIMYMYKEFGTLSLFLVKFYSLDYLYLYMVMIMAFMVKMPMYFVHLWLPKAHVEAPVSGSMILAGIMLKLGGYGMMRIFIFLEYMSMQLNFIWICISLVGGFYISLMCFCQVDMKSLIAYSSVSHMSIVLAGIMTLNYWGFMGSFILMIGHGLCSSGMFCLVNINYERLSSRSLYINKGMLNFMPSMSLMWFLLMSSNMAAPTSFNLLGEINLINSLMGWSYFSIIMLMLISFFSAGYSLYLYSFTQHGKLFLGNYSFFGGVSREYLLLMLHWLPLNIIFMKCNFLLSWL
uniref:NADH dehydrogenase subunit 4 n=1 Tax=Coptotriche turpinia TaxID=2984363 RepID=UPI0022378E79|nr:NADH dehydrogenase subunit 4 [Coptotriche turpinia]UYB79011.1 NADH dehydrogenase subunit 4 [Coptotriche turpinia]